MSIDLNTFLKNYNTPSHPIAFAGIQKIYRYYKKTLPYSKIREYLEYSYPYTLHKETKKQVRNPHYIYYKRQQFQIDLIDVRELQNSNDGVKFLLTCIDSFTKKAFVRECRNKTANEVINKFKSILDEAETYPKTLLSDKGSEIKNKQFAQFCNHHNIKQIFPENEVHATIVERFNKTLQVLLYKYLTKYETNTYLNVLQDLVKTYNNRYHSFIKMTPNEAELPSNSEKVFMRFDEHIRKIKKRRTKPKYKIGDEVRIKPLKSKFKRAYDVQFSEEIFIIDKIKDNLAIITYNLKDLNNEELIGSFYENELVKVVNDHIYKINKILARKRKNGIMMAYVSWKGYGDKFNSWIPLENVKSI